MERVHLVNAIVFRKDLRGLYFRDKDGWKPIQVAAAVTGKHIVSSLNRYPSD